MTDDRLNVAVATPLSEELCALIEELEPRVRLIRDQTLLPTMRHPADFSGDPSFRRTEEQQERFESMLDAADVLYGIPDVDPAALRRVVRANPRLRWVQVMAAGGGQAPEHWNSPFPRFSKFPQRTSSRTGPPTSNSR